MPNSYNLSYAELIDDVFQEDPLYLGFSEALQTFSYAEATDTLAELELFHNLYVATMDAMSDYSFSEADYSFSGLMNFIKSVSDFTKKGVDRHNAAADKFLDVVGTPGATAGRAQDFLNNLSTSVIGGINQAQYKNLLKNDPDEKEYGKNANLAKLVKFLDSGWDRDKGAKEALGMWGSGQESLHQKGKEGTADRLEGYKSNKDSAKDKELRYFTDDEDDETENKPNEKSSQQSSKPEDYKARLKALLPDLTDEDLRNNHLDPDGVDESVEKNSVKQPKQSSPDSSRSSDDVYNSLSKNLPDLSRKDFDARESKGQFKGKYSESANTSFMENLDMLSAFAEENLDSNAKNTLLSLLESILGGQEEEYGENERMYNSFMQKSATSHNPEDKERYARQAREYKPAAEESASPSSGGSGEGLKYKRMYDSFMNKANSSSNPEDRNQYMRQAKEYKAKMAYSEAMRLGYTDYAQELLDVSYQIVREREGLNFAESRPTKGEVLAKAAYYTFNEGSYDNDYADNERKGSYENDTEQAQKIRAMRDRLKADSAQKANPFYGNPGKPLPEFADSDKAAGGGSEEEQMEMLISQLSDEEKEMLIKLLEEGNSAPEPKKEEKKEEKEYSDSSYSEALAKKDKQKALFIKECKDCFAEFDYVNNHYNVPLVFSEGSTYNFSEWVDSFKKANSAAFNLFGNECGFNGRLPADLVVVNADEDTDAAWAVYDTNGKFVTLSGIRPFQQLAFSENFKNAYCQSTQGSAIKSDRIARQAMCSR